MSGDREDLGLRGAVARLRELLTEIDQSDCEWSRGPLDFPKPEAIDNVAAYLREGADEIHAVYVKRGDESLIVALTGNAQFGRVHADFIAHARNWLPGLLTFVEETLADDEPAVSK